MPPSRRPNRTGTRRYAPLKRDEAMVDERNAARDDETAESKLGGPNRVAPRGGGFLNTTDQRREDEVDEVDEDWTPYDQDEDAVVDVHYDADDDVASQVDDEWASCDETEESDDDAYSVYSDE